MNSLFAPANSADPGAVKEIADFLRVQATAQFNFAVVAVDAVNGEDISENAPQVRVESCIVEAGVDNVVTLYASNGQPIEVRFIGDKLIVNLLSGKGGKGDDSQNVVQYDFKYGQGGCSGGIALHKTKAKAVRKPKVKPDKEEVNAEPGAPVPVSTEAPA